MTRSLTLIPAEQRSILLCLSPQQCVGRRWTIIPIVVSRVLQRDPSEQSPEDIEAESALLDLVGEVQCPSPPEEGTTTRGW
jgi:hypothetical protein